MMKNLAPFSTLTCYSLCLGLTGAAKILASFLVPSQSHHIVYQPILRELSRRGHELTVITPVLLEDPSLTSYTQIDVSYAHDVLQDLGKSYFGGRSWSPWKLAVGGHLGLFLLMRAELLHPSIQVFLNDKAKEFDLVLIEPLHPLQYGYGGRFNCPMVGLLAHFANLNVHFAAGNTNHPIISPDPLFGFVGDLSFGQRLESVLFSVVSRVIYNYITLPLTNMAAKVYFGDDIATLGELEKNLSVLLTSTHPLLHGIRPNVPTVIELGKVQRLTSNQSLDQELSDFLDSASEGVVYFSLGSMMKSTSLTNKIDFVKRIFSELPQKVLWKWDENHLLDLPKNVKVSTWVPQEHVLQHPNVKVFVTHAGPLSIEEALTARVPMLTLPLQFDQFLMANKVVELGIGRKLDVDHLDNETFREALTDILSNPRYKENIDKIATLIEDQPMDGLEKAVWWIEYVIRHKGTKHLRNPGDNLPLYQYYLFDVIGAIFALMFLLYLTYKIIRSLFKYSELKHNIQRKNKVM